MNNEAAVGFVRNLQGDIIAVVNQEGTALLEYSYDPWGRVTITQNGENLTEQERQIIAVLCPFAYRGYNYDYTTGLYYLQSRYYNPEWGRFLNVDDTNILLSTQGAALGVNLFAYCNNDPVNMVDYTGNWGKQVHKDDTLVWAKNFFYANDAKIIAEANHNMDSISEGNHAMFVSQQRFHFNRNPKGMIDSRKLFAIACVFIAAIYWVRGEYYFEHSQKTRGDFIIRDGNFFAALTYLGNGLHSIQDYEGHGNIGVDSLYAQHIIPNRKNVHKADDINYSWVSGSNRTALYRDVRQTRYKQTRTDTYNYFIAFSEAVALLRKEYKLPNKPLNKYLRWNPMYV